jgi:hypothetical protein
MNRFKKEVFVEKNDLLRRDFMKISGIAGLTLSLVPGGLSVSVDPASWTDIENPMSRLTPLRAPKRAIEEVVPGFLWIDAAQFDSYGGWDLDNFYTHLEAASGYLLANSFAGPPVEDAVTSIGVASGGVWHLWARTRNWLPDHSPGQFKVLVNGNDNGRVFGAAESDRWGWESGGAYELPPGKTELRIRDLTGHLGRVSALVLTRDETYRPPVGRDALVIERARLCGMSLAPADRGSFDVIVAGGGPAGVPAAIAAARNGCRVALIHDRPILGGNASLELGVPPNGAARHGTFDRETGIIEEIRNVGSIHSPWKTAHGKVAGAMEIMVANEPNITLFLNEHVDRADTEGDRIRSVCSHNTLTGERSIYRGETFIDCTGDGWLGFHAGAEYRLGREARSEFGESYAPLKADNATMSGSLTHAALKPGFFYHAENKGKPVQFVLPEWAVEIPNPERFADHRKIDQDVLKHGSYWIEYPGQTDDLFEKEKARDTLYRLTLGVWDYLKNKWPEKDSAANWDLVDVPYRLGMRETRRLIGDHILSQTEVQNAELFPDRIAYAGWTLDVHHVDGVLGSAKVTAYERVPVNHVPYRCLYSKNIENLLFAGRNGSFTAIALGAVRVEVTLATLGQAVGTAAALCKKHGCAPRGIYQRHLEELQQQLLKDDQYIIGMVNEDPADKALRAKAKASGSMSPESGPENVINGIARPFEGKPNCWESRPLADGPQWIELEFPRAERINAVYLTFDTGLSQRWMMMGSPAIEGLVKGFSVSCFDGSKWHTVAVETKNYQRRVICRFQGLETQKIRVTAEQTCGAPTAKIYEIRAYNEG